MKNAQTSVYIKEDGRIKSVLPGFSKTKIFFAKREERIAFMKNKRTAARRPGKSVLFAAVALLFGLLTAFSRPCAAGAQAALERCGSTLIPSLFPFLVLCGFTVRCGFAQRCGRFFAPLTRILFCLPGCTAAVILTAWIGGYPVGARGIRSLLDQGAITEEQAARMSCFCVGAGPGFLVAAVGEGIFHSTALGLLLLAAQIFSALALGVVTGISARRKEGLPMEKAVAAHPEPAGEALVAAVADGTQAMLSLCAFVVLFGAFLGLCSQLRLPALLAAALKPLGVPISAGIALLPVLLEVCSGTAAAAASAETAIFLTAFTLGWGGLCVHFQIFSILGRTPYSRARFFSFAFSTGCFPEQSARCFPFCSPSEVFLPFQAVLPHFRFPVVFLLPLHFYS
jgi:sporulation integral membrane protein YlbJ